MRHCLLAGLLLFSIAVSLNALTLDEVMDRHIEALGGLDNIRNIISARTVATVETAGMVGELTISYVYPDKIRNDIVLPMAKLIQAADGDNMWTVDLNGQPRKMSGDEKKEMVSTLFLASGKYLEAKYRGDAVSYKGELKVDETTYHVLAIEPENGLPMTMFIDPETYLISFTEAKVQMFNIRVRQDDYREIDGVMVAFHSKQETGVAILDMELTTTSHEFNVAIDDGAFRFPRDEVIDYSILDGGPSRVNFKLSGNHIYIPVKINGAGPYSFVLDSGAGLTVVGSNVASDLKLPVTGELPAVGMGGVEVGSFAEADSITVGDVVIRNLVIGKIDLEGLNRFTSERVDGILGYDIFTRFVVRIDYYDSVLTIFLPDDSSAIADGCVLGIEIEMNHPMITGVVNDSIQGRFRVDTGSMSYLDLNSEIVRKYDLVAQSRTEPVELHLRGIGDETITSLAGRLASLKLCDFELTDIPCGFTLSDSGILAIESVDGNIGSGILSQFICTFDYSRNRLTLSPNPDFSEPIEILSTGLRLMMDEDRFIVVDVIFGSSAADKEIMAGDVVVSIDGSDLSELGLFEVMELLEPPDRESVEIVISRDGERKKIRLDRRILF